MKYSIDKQFLVDCFRRIVSVPSPVGYDVLLNPVLEDLAAQSGHAVTYDDRGTPYITLDGEDNSKTVLIGAHADTIGLMVRCVESNGTLRVTALGGVNFCNTEGSSVTVHTRDGRIYTGMLLCNSHSTHVFSDARTLPRNDETMFVLLDEPVTTKADVLALGISIGDYVNIDPACEYTQTGYLKSRFIDDKAAIACVFTMLKYLMEHRLKPKYRTLLAFPYFEENGLGGRYVPAEVSEYIAVDIGLIGPKLEGNDQKVSICAKDNHGPYDYQLTNHLITCARQADVDYVLDVFFRYSTDGHAAMRGGGNLRAAAFGMACWSSHGRERTHIDGLAGTTNLLLSYVLGAGRL